MVGTQVQNCLFVSLVLLWLTKETDCFFRQVFFNKMNSDIWPEETWQGMSMSGTVWYHHEVWSHSNSISVKSSSLLLYVMFTSSFSQLVWHTGLLMSLSCPVVPCSPTLCCSISLITHKPSVLPSVAHNADESQSH